MSILIQKHLYEITISQLRKVGRETVIKYIIQYLFKEKKGVFSVLEVFCLFLFL